MIQIANQNNEPKTFIKLDLSAHYIFGIPMMRFLFSLAAISLAITAVYEYFC